MTGARNDKMHRINGTHLIRVDRERNLSTF